MTDRQLINRIRKLAALDAQAKAITAEAEAIKAEVKAAISERDDFGPRFEFAGNGVKVSWTSHEKRVFDARAFCADPKRAELYESFKKTVSERPFKWAITEVRA